jgi:hypothetical protein
MKAVLRLVGMVALIAGLTTTTSAQWPKHPSRNVPKSPNGEPNLKSVWRACGAASVASAGKVRRLRRRAARRSPGFATSPPTSRKACR